MLHKTSIMLNPYDNTILWDILPFSSSRDLTKQNSVIPYSDRKNNEVPSSTSLLSIDRVKNYALIHPVNLRKTKDLKYM